MARPGAQDALFQAHVQELWRAVVDGDPSEALPFFFPSPPISRSRGSPIPSTTGRPGWSPTSTPTSTPTLVADFDADVDHLALGPQASLAQFSSVTVPSDAVWVVPGTEYNKGSYWRVYDSSVDYVVNGHSGSFVIASMISWRGEWYVVHLASIR
jgi:hypothetical protein